MRLHACITQALLPQQNSLAQLPNIKPDEVSTASDMNELFNKLEGVSDGRVADVKKAIERWGKVDVVDASFKGDFVSLALRRSVITNLPVSHRRAPSYTVCHSVHGFEASLGIAIIFYRERRGRRPDRGHQGQR